MEVLEKIIKNGYNVNLISFSAIDYYLTKKLSDRYVYLTTDATLIEISKIFEKIDFGYNLFDFAIIENNKTYLVKSGEYPDFPFIIQYFTYNLNYEKFKNIFESFNHIKRKETILKDCFNNSLTAIIEASKLISKYQIFPEIKFNEIRYIPLSKNCQKELLIMNLSGDYCFAGFEFLLESGFIEHYWKELFEMVKIEQVKDYHPEGNVWQHTMEALKYRKKKSLILSLALLFHDIGKAFTHEYNNKRFYKHAQIGAVIAEKFLKNLEFEDNVINKTVNLIKYHMLPEAIDRIPKHKLEKLKKEVDFNLLFELYRADISSSFKKLNDFYKFKKYIKSV